MHTNITTIFSHFGTHSFGKWQSKVYDTIQIHIEQYVPCIRIVFVYNIYYEKLCVGTGQPFLFPIKSLSIRPSICFVHVD